MRKRAGGNDNSPTEVGLLPFCTAILNIMSLGIYHPEFKVLKRYNTAEKIQTLLEKIPMNHEENGETCMSPLTVLHENKAHCFEGALLACVCLMLQDEKPIIISLKAEKTDFDHIITVFKQNGYYGGISKTNHLVLRYRDPVYRSIRELAMSYFHEYFHVKNGKKTMLGYTNPINMKRYGIHWMTREDDLWDIAEIIFDTPYNMAVPSKNKHLLRKATPFECRGGVIVEWPENNGK